MFNVLPDGLKEQVRKEYATRMWIMVGVVCVCVQISALFFLFPSIEASMYKKSDIVLSLDSLRSAQKMSEQESWSQRIPRTNATLEMINTMLQYPRVVPAMELILSKRPHGILLTDIAYESKDAANSSVVLRGVSKDREALVSFVKTLKESAFFESVELPVSNLAKEKNIDFSISTSIMLKK
jgi:hypothetical protein